MNELKEDVDWWNSDPSTDIDGVGIIAELIEGRWTIQRVFVGSPAEHSGILDGDVIQSVSGEDITGESESLLGKAIAFRASKESIELNLLRTEKSVQLKVSPEPLRTILDRDLKEASPGVLRSCRTCENCNNASRGYWDCKLLGGSCERGCAIA